MASGELMIETKTFLPKSGGRKAKEGELTYSQIRNRKINGMLPSG